MNRKDHTFNMKIGRIFKTCLFFTISTMLLFLIWVNEGVSEESIEKTNLTKPNKTQTSSNNTPLEILESMKKQRTDLMKREEEVKKEEKRLNDLKDLIDTKISEYKALRADLEKMVKKLEEFDDENLKHLVKVYEAMKPEEAGPLLSTLKEDIAIKVFKKMNNKKVAKILPFIESHKAKKISEALIKKN